MTGRKDGCPNACADPTASPARALVVEPFGWTPAKDASGVVGAYMCPVCRGVWQTSWLEEPEPAEDLRSADDSNVVPLRSTAPVP